MAEETKIIRIVIDSSKAVEGSAAATRALERLEKSQGAAASSMDRMERALDRMGGFMKANLALLVADMAARFIQMGKNAFDAASGLDELAEQLGITAKGLQGLQFSAVQNGIKLEQLETGISKFSQKMGEAAGGSKEMITALNNIGVKILDVNGKLRPTEDALQDVSAAIAAIDDPARRSAAAVEFFGKSGTKMLPMLKDMSGGMDEMAARAKAAGAFIEAETVAKLDKLADSAAKAGIATRALFAEASAGPLTGVLDILEKQLGKISGYIRAIKADWTNVFTADSNAEAKLNLTITDRETKIREAEARIAKDPGRAADFRFIDQSRGEISRARAELAKMDAATGRNVGLVDPVPRSSDLPPSGFSNPTPTGSGDAAGDRLQKALQDSRRELDAARAFAAASNDGALAVANLETHFKALKTAQDVFGKTAEQNEQGVKALTAQLEAAAQAAQKAITLKDFNLGTVELEKANELLAAENRLINATVETRAIEIAQIKLKQELQAKGIAGDTEEERRAIERRSIALETGERLKAQGEEIKKANELWTAPLKSALESIQKVGADAFEQMLTNGNFTFQSLGDTFKKIVIRMAAEFMALAMIRPVMTVMVNAVSPGMASSMGLGGGGGMSMPSMGGAGGGGGFSMPSMGSGMFGSASDWTSSAGSGFSMPEFMGGSGSGSIGGFFGQTLYGGGSNAAVSAMSMADPMAQGAMQAAGGLGGAGVTLGGALSGVAGIGMGAYTLATANGSTGKTISGIGQMIGGGMMLIPGMQIPGMIVTALATILPMLMPDAETRTHSSTNANLRYGGGNWYTTGGAYGSGANSGQSESALRGLTGNIDKVFGMLGGVTDPSKVWGMNASSWTAQGQDWSYTSQATDLVDPSGNQQSWRMNEDNMMDTGSAQLVIRSILGGAVGEISSTMKTALEAMRGASMGMKETAEGIGFVDQVYERLGKGALTVRTQFRELENQFAEMTATAQKLGLSLAPVEAEQKKATERLGKDFIDGMLDPLAVQLRALDDQRMDSLASAEYIRDNVKDVYVDIAKITEYWNTKRLDLEAQYQEASVGQLQALIRRLTYGDLANASPDTSYTGTRGTYQATLAQARAGSGVALNNLAGTAESFAGSARSFFASGPEYAAIVVQLRRDLLEVMGSGANAPASGAANGEAQSNALAQQFAELMSAFQISQQNSAALQIKISELTAQLQRAA